MAGDPIKVEGRTLIPIVSIGFGFGAGGGEGKGDGKRMGEGTGGGTGGGAWIKPVAVIIIDKDDVKVESVKGGLSYAIGKIGDAIPQAMEKCAAAWMERKKEDKEE